MATGVMGPPSLPVRRPPTHVLTVEVPLHLEGERGDFDPIHDAVYLVLSMSRAVYVGAICDDPQVALREVEAT